jgi:hypothetical protein
MIFEKELTALGFSTFEIGAIAWVLLRMGFIPVCEHTRPRLDEMRWQKGMGEMGFGPDAIALAESAIFNDGKVGTA